MIYETSLQEALKIIADYCRIHKNTCHGCVFNKNRHDTSCVLEDVHESYNIHEAIERIIKNVGETPIIVDTTKEVWHYDA